MNDVLHNAGNENLEDQSAPILSSRLPDEAATRYIAARLSNILQAGDVVCLWGDLGAGKSTFARAIIQSMLSEETEAPSPTFTLVQVYEAENCDLYHYDLYRLEEEDEVLELGIDEAFSEGISLIEWPDRLGSYLPWDRLDILLTHEKVGGTVRNLEMHATHQRWAEKLQGLLAD